MVIRGISHGNRDMIRAYDETFEFILRTNLKKKTFRTTRPSDHERLESNLRDVIYSNVRMFLKPELNSIKCATNLEFTQSEFFLGFYRAISIF